MIIKGLQKLTLLDYPEKTACTVFTGGCNFRCPFCHNSSLVFMNNNDDDITEEEVFAHLTKRKGILDGVCITGGEPLLQNDLEAFIRRIKEMGYLVKLDTNGYAPKKMKKLIEDGLLDYVAMDIKNSPEKYAITSGLDKINFSNIKESIDFLINGNIKYEFRTTAVAEFHTLEDFEKIGQTLQNADRYYIQNFVDSGELICGGLHALSKNEMFQAKTIVNRYVHNVELRGI